MTWKEEEEALNALVLCKTILWGTWDKIRPQHPEKQGVKDKKAADTMKRMRLIVAMYTAKLHIGPSLVGQHKRWQHGTEESSISHLVHFTSCQTETG